MPKKSKKSSGKKQKCGAMDLESTTVCFEEELPPPGRAALRAALLSKSKKLDSRCAEMMGDEFRNIEHHERDDVEIRASIDQSGAEVFEGSVGAEEKIGDMDSRVNESEFVQIEDLKGSEDDGVEVSEPDESATPESEAPESDGCEKDSVGEDRTAASVRDIGDPLSPSSIDLEKTIISFGRRKGEGMGEILKRWSSSQALCISGIGGGVDTQFGGEISRLDLHDPSSELARSQYWGIMNLAVVLAAFYLVANPITRLYDGTPPFDLTLGAAMFEDFFLLMLHWLEFCVWSFCSYFLFLLFLRGYIARRTLRIAQHLTQAVPIFYGIASCLLNDWPIIPSGFILVLASIYFMKMHSFTETNLDFADQLASVPSFPRNVNIVNYSHYLLSPTLIYEPELPTGHGFRSSYFFQKVGYLIGAMLLLYVVLTTHVIPVMLDSPNNSFVHVCARLIVPFLVVDVVIFYIIFECICNLLAEISNYADRRFYSDWWNSTTFDEYSRKWNRPVHQFLLKHVYLTTMKYRTKTDASVATFLFSALMHEMIMAVCFRTIRMYLFGLMMLQIPLIALGKKFQGTMIGNLLFWFGMVLGVPLLSVCYGREWALKGQQADAIRLF